MSCPRGRAVPRSLRQTELVSCAHKQTLSDAVWWASSLWSLILEFTTGANLLDNEKTELMWRSGDASTFSTQEMKNQWMANGITLDTQKFLSKAQAQNYAGFIFLLYPDRQFGPQIHLHYLCCWRCTFRWGIRYALGTHLPTSDNKWTRKFSHCCALSSLNPNSVLRNVIHNCEKWHPALIDRGRDVNERRDAEIKVDLGSTSTGESE